jgi:hypothetical protein
MHAYGSRHPGAAPVRHAQADCAACGLVSTEAPGRSGVPARRGARLQGTGGRGRLDTLTRRLLVELNASGCANRTNLPTARRVGRRRRAGLPQTGRSSTSRSASRVLRDRPLGKRGAANRRSAGSSRRLCGAHNSAIRHGHRHAVDAATATVGKASAPVRHLSGSGLMKASVPLPAHSNVSALPASREASSPADLKLGDALPRPVRIVGRSGPSKDAVRIADNPTRCRRDTAWIYERAAMVHFGRGTRPLSRCRGDFREDVVPRAIKRDSPPQMLSRTLYTTSYCRVDLTSRPGRRGTECSL